MQSSRVRVILIALLGVFALSAVAAAAAQAEEAPSWSIGGARLATGETHYLTGKTYSNETFKGFTFTGVGKNISCESIRLKEGVLLGSSAGNPGTSDGIIEFFGGCKVTGNGTKCKVVEPIISNNVKSELVESEKGEKGSLLAEFFPATGTVFTTLRFEAEAGGSCALSESKIVGKIAAQVLTDPNNGKLGELVKLPNEKKEAHSWLLNFPAVSVAHVWLIKGGTGEEAKIELTASGEPIGLTGTALALLAKKNSKGELESEEVNWSPLP